MLDKVKDLKNSLAARITFGLVLALACIYLFVFAYSSCIRPDTKPRQLAYSSEEINAAAKSRELTLQPGDAKTIAQAVPDAEYLQAAEFFRLNSGASSKTIKNAVAGSKLPSWYPRGESPLLQEIVVAGGLPSVAERTGPEPVVLCGVDGAGKYGGVWQRDAVGIGDLSIMRGRMGYPFLFRFGPFGDPVMPHIAKSYKMLENGKIWEITLRKIKWSDGTPVTADDLMFWWSYTKDKRISAGIIPSFMMVRGKPGEIEKVDAHTVRFKFPLPYGSFLEQLTQYPVLIPKHYYMKFHPDYADAATVKKQLASVGFQSARQYFDFIKHDVRVPDVPTLFPWISRRYENDGPFIFVRNPYYFAVDEQGNQLPYIDRVQMNVVKGSNVSMDAATGKLSMQARGLKFDDYTSIMGMSKEYNTRLYCWIAGDAPNWMIYPNLLRLVDDKDPGSAAKAKVLADKTFRQAVSIGIDRKRINRAFYNDVGVIAQAGPGPLSQYHSPEWSNAYVDLDIKEANAKLDEVWRRQGWDPDVRSGGFRCGPDGNPLTFFLILNESYGIGPAQFVADDWAKLGLRCMYRVYDSNFSERVRFSLNWDFIIYPGYGEYTPIISGRTIIPFNVNTPYAVPWARWFQMGGFFGNKSVENNPGCIPVPDTHPMYKAIQLYVEAAETPSLQHRKDLLQQIYSIAAENVWSINICNLPVLVVASKDMKNVPEKAIYSATFNSSANAGFETYYFEHPSHVADKDTLEQLRQSKPFIKTGGNASTAGAAKKKSAAESGGFDIASVLAWSFASIMVLVMILAVLKHPYLVKRLLVIIPTLLIISVCVFSIIQLPPVSFLDTLSTQYQLSGESPQQIEEKLTIVKDYFHLDEPQWQRYCRWAGFTWFVTYKEADKGLLQGDLGRTMVEPFPKINTLIGDRLLLTVLIAIGTILLTWLLAIPIGIYTACKQYTAGDYIFTIIGFIGMSLPEFFIALIFMCVFGVSGLFSANFAIQPFWDWPKVVDLLKHIWIPILVMGIGGTAGMIRIMRANLLDELNKPYVTTARAKGVRPLKLLLKYPVRIALNPFVSGIGHLFPHVISGGAIVAIVLSLPTIPPLLYEALFQQNTTVAGSVLMLLSTLAVLGTFISDLLLLALDPRIRMSMHAGK